MYALIDIGKTKEAIHYYYGVMDLTTRSISYYTKKEFIKFIQNEKTQIQGIKVNSRHTDFVISNEISDLYKIKIIPVPEISFLDDKDCYEARHGYYFLYGDSNLSCVKEIEFNQILRIDKIIEGIKFWYKGICLVYKKKKNGFNINGTLKWDKKGSMTNEKFNLVVNNLNKFYPIVGLYRAKFPLCKCLDFTYTDLSNINTIREFMWHNNSIKIVNFGFMNLSNIVDGDKIFHGNEKLEIIDMRNCIGDISENSNFTFCLNINCINCVLLLPKTAPNLIKQLTDSKMSGNFSCSQFNYCGNLDKNITYSDIKNTFNLYKSKQLLLEKDNKIRNKPLCFVLE